MPLGTPGILMWYFHSLAADCDRGVNGEAGGILCIVYGFVRRRRWVGHFGSRVLVLLEYTYLVISWVSAHM